MVIESVVVQPFASVTSTEYGPAVSPVIVAVVSPLLHKYVYGEVPLLAVTVADPKLLLLHVPLVSEILAFRLPELMITPTLLDSPL